MPPVKFADRIVSVADPKVRDLPPRVRTLLAQLKLTEPPKGQIISMAMVDTALKGMSISKRLEAKAELRSAELIA